MGVGFTSAFRAFLVNLSAQLIAHVSPALAQKCRMPAGNELSANGNLSLNSVSQPRGSLQSTREIPRIIASPGLPSGPTWSRRSRTAPSIANGSRMRVTKMVWSHPASPNRRAGKDSRNFAGEATKAVRAALPLFACQRRCKNPHAG
jgi:hypothetical protein